ncbi:nucleotide exchange factor GrpE [Candidatus Acetothermia bacterium]|nr:MAG: nucleotide exchange factor GrpE [Candidatus Acetothermia bacterium]
MSEKEKEKPIEEKEQPSVEAGEIAKKDEEIRNLVDRLKRLQAEFENYKRRTSKELESLAERISDRTILEFLPLYDNLQRAFANYASDKNVEGFIAGMERIFAQFTQLLEQKGVTKIEAVGKKFDPALHEALLSVESEEEKNTIIEEFSAGYIREGRVLSPSRVTVSKGPARVKEEGEG